MWTLSWHLSDHPHRYPRYRVPLEQFRHIWRVDLTAVTLWMPKTSEHAVWTSNAFLYLSGLVAAVFSATVGNEEIGSHQNMQAYHPQHTFPKTTDHPA